MRVGGRLPTLCVTAGALVGMGRLAAHVPDPVAEEITFQRDGITFRGTLYLARRAGRQPALVALHAANGGTRDYPAYHHLATDLPAAGFAVLLFDRRGEGGSGGDARTATFTDLAADGIAAISYLKSRPEIDPTRVGIWGMSQGSWLATLAASMSSDISFVIAVSAPGVSPAHQMDYTAQYALRQSGQPPPITDRAIHVRTVVDEYYRGHLPRAQAQTVVDSIRGQPWFPQVFLPNSGILPTDPSHTRWGTTLDYDPLVAIAAIKVPMIFFFAETDPYVPVDSSIARIRETAHGDATIRRIPDTDHFMSTGSPSFTGPTSRVYVAELLDWLARHEGGPTRGQ